MSDWEEVLVGEREAKDRFFSEADSPLAEEDRISFKGLAYFPPDESYRVMSRFEPFVDPDTVVLGTTTGEARKMIRAGLLHFVLRGDSLKLTAYQSVPSHESLFVPFGDETNSVETYAGGRYIDIPEEEMGGTLYLDFNKAYNPYCAYNEGWSCPLVPRENYLPVPVQAGEKAYAE